MLYTSGIEDNGTSINSLEKLYSEQKLNAIVRFLKVRISPYARAVGDTLLVAGLEKDFETDLTINEIASKSGVSRSMTIQSLKLLVDLQIFHKQEEINKPCTYRFNFNGEWLQYSTPEPKEKVVRFPVLEPQENENDSWSPQDTLQEEELINPPPLPFEPGDEERYEQPHLDYANDPIFVAAAEAHAELSKPKPQKVLKIKDGDWYWEVPPNTDVESGRVIEQIVEKEGLTVQKAVSQVVKLASEVMKIFAELKIPFRITESPAEAIKRLLEAIAKSNIVNLPNHKKDKEISRQQWEEQSLEQWWQNNRENYGDRRNYKDLSLLNGCERFIPDPETNVPITISALREREQSPKMQQAI